MAAAGRGGYKVPPLRPVKASSLVNQRGPARGRRLAGAPEVLWSPVARGGVPRVTGG